jgi:hypothetical protein
LPPAMTSAMNLCCPSIGGCAIGQLNYNHFPPLSAVENRL